MEESVHVPVRGKIRWFFCCLLMVPGFLLVAMGTLRSYIEPMPEVGWLYGYVPVTEYLYAGAVLVVPSVVYLYLNFRDMKKLCMAVRKHKEMDVKVLNPLLAVLLLPIPLFNILVLTRKRTYLNHMLDKTRLPIKERVMSPGRFFLSYLLLWLVIPGFFLLREFFRWQQVMNQAAIVVNA